MWNKDYSLKLSIYSIRLFFVAWCIFTMFGYFIVRAFVRYNSLFEAFQTILITLYLCLALAIFLLYCLDRLLTNIQKDLVFMDENTTYLRNISWLCMGVGVITLCASIGYPPFLLVSFAFAFIALIVRVVKNVIAQAIVLKEESDYTI